ncbi:hypothetical protein OH784_29895 [Ectobacillus funiculus]|uniref:hypothetical protein n=1 Tax=Ectobacillus funiculus TaxID=137993 RepID=UPI0039792F7B
MKKGILFAVLAVLMLGVVSCSNQDEKKSSNSLATSKSVSISGITAGMKTALSHRWIRNFYKA